MPYKTVIVEKEGKIGRLTLNRPDKLNAINDTMLREIEEGLEELRKDGNIWLVIIKGAGKSFSAGQDLSGVDTAEVMPPDPHAKPYLSEIFEGAEKLGERLRHLYAFPRFTIAQVHGYCLGLGATIAMCCRALVCTEDAVFGDPSIRMGLAVPNPLWTWRVGLKKTKELLLTGRYINGKEAEQIGLAMAAVPAFKLDEFVREEAEAQLRFGGIGGYDMQSAWRVAHETNMDIAGLAAAWRFSSYLYGQSSIQRPGRSYIDRGGVDFTKIRREKGLKPALAARDEPTKKYFPAPAAPKAS
ncbi:MAG: enoyl-CoA hydratase/isomerase family protein [Chloroflexi bacterium]|nr:enoyl-CoA hydratase/isomerase family protein [Chloroflexota bacterium]